jgi:hypothetical protein
VSEVLLYTDDATQALEEIAHAGGHVLHVLTPSVLVAELPMPVTLTTCTTVRPESLDPDSARVADAWTAARSKQAATAEGIPWDSPGYEPPD